MLNPRHLIAVTAIALVLASAGRAEATEELRKELSVMAKQIASALKGMEESNVTVGSFIGPSTLPTSSGPTFTKMLGEELSKTEISVKDKSKYSIKGSFVDVINASTGLLGAQIKGELIERTNNNVLTTFTRGVTGQTTLATLFGVTADLPSNATPEKRDEALKNGLDSPKVFINETKVAATKNSQYAIEMLVKGPQGYVPRPSVEDEGLAFCKIARNELYAVRVFNLSPYDCAVTLSVDGLSVFAFSENKGYTHYIVPAGGKADILGWHRTNQVSDSFRVVGYGESEVARLLPSSSSVGTITAVFAAAWNAGTTPPPDEAPRSKDAPPADATDRGPAVAAKFVEVVKDVGVPRSTVSIRYAKPDPTDLPQ